MQEASGEFNNCSYVMQRMGRAAMNFINFMKVASADLFRTEGSETKSSLL